MSLFGFIFSSLRHHYRAHLAVALGVVIATATLTGAMIVGDSMRDSLRDVAIGRLGPVTHAMTSSRFFRDSLIDTLRQQDGFDSYFSSGFSAIIMPGGVAHADSGARANHIQIVGFTGGSVMVNKRLAVEIGVKVGDDILIRLGKPSAISTETLLGRRDDTTTTMRLTVAKLAEESDYANFGLDPRQSSPRNVFIPLEDLQRTVKQRGRANAILLIANQHDAPTPAQDWLTSALQQSVSLEDYGLTLRQDESRRYISLDSEAMLLAPVVESAANSVGGELQLPTSPIVTYLANSISLLQPKATVHIPYSTVVAIQPRADSAISLTLTDSSTIENIPSGNLLLNEWAASDLGASVGQSIELTYYVTGEFGKLSAATSTFHLQGIVKDNPQSLDRGFIPAYPGITDAKSMTDWDPPFPVDLKRVRDKDDDYWEKHGPTPKAFISLEDGRRLWADNGQPQARATSVRFHVSPERPIQAVSDEISRRMIASIKPAQLDLNFKAVRANAITASSGSTDFGGLFIGFSIFLIASSVMLVALLFRLGVEQRVKDIGILSAVGIPTRTILRLLLAEGCIVIAVSAVVGLAGAAGYAWLMLTGLRTSWSAAANAPFLSLSLSPVTLGIGYAASCAVALASITKAVRDIKRSPTRAMLSGAIRPENSKHKSPRKKWKMIASLSGVFAISLMVLPSFTDALPPAIAFFLSGALLLVMMLALISGWLAKKQRSTIKDGGTAAMCLLGIRNAPRHAGRSLLIASLIASAAFLVTALEAFHLDATTDTAQKDSGSGGFSLVAESTLALPYDLNTADGREALNITEKASQTLASTSTFPMRLRPGDASSCLNLYMPSDPRLAGVSDKFINRGGFIFSKSLAESKEEIENPWLLLQRTLDDGVIPVIGDENAVLWQWHLGLGKDLVMQNEQGQEVTLRFVALLSGSILQDELIIAESRFTKLFPSIHGHNLFLFETPTDSIETVSQLLETELQDFSFDVSSSQQRLNEFLAVQNTYLGTFQTLGGLGLILGTIGLAVVLLRNVWERRGELALMRALGFTHRSLGWMVLAENTTLVVLGLTAGIIPAAVAIAPHLINRPQAIPWASIVMTIVGTLIVGIGGGAAALIPTLKTPLLPALRSE